MYRNIMDEMAIWYEQPDRKMLYLKGAYGVGKTWSVKDFSTAFFDAMYYIDLETEPEFKQLFDEKKHAGDLDNMIKAKFASAFENDSSEKTADMSKGLLIFDEINESSDALQLIHEYSIFRNDLTICAISSSVEVTDYEKKNENEIQTIILKPMCFQEYLIANKENKLIELIENLKIYTISEEKKKKIMRYLREFLVIGGMPKVVNDFLKYHDYTRTKKIQRLIIEKFEQRVKKDINQTMCTRTRRILRSIPRQLEKDNKKFMFSLVEQNARKREYSEAVEYLCNSGMVIRLESVNKGVAPLCDYANASVYELFLIDNGLLFTLMNYEINEKLEDEEAVRELFGCLNGGYGEQFVMSELLGNPNIGKLYYWVSGATARVPLVFEGDDDIIPVDIRFETNTKAQNVKVFTQKYGTKMSLRLSIEDMYFDNNTLNIPVYGLWNF